MPFGAPPQPGNWDGAWGGEVQDYYATLGVSRYANAEELKKAWKQKVLGCHPDKLPAAAGSPRDKKRAEEAFRRVQVAYETLSDPRARAGYDRLRAEQHRGLFQHYPPGNDAAGSAGTAERGSGAGAGQMNTTPRSRGPVSAGVVGPTLPRYRVGARFTQSARQARRNEMARRTDPAQYTIHRNGRPGDPERQDPQDGSATMENPLSPWSSSGPRRRVGKDSGPPQPGGFDGHGFDPFFGTAGGGAQFGSGPPPVPAAAREGQVRNPAWLQRQLDYMERLEREQEEKDRTKYQWGRQTAQWSERFRARKEERFLNEQVVVVD